MDFFGWLLKKPVKPAFSYALQRYYWKKYAEGWNIVIDGEPISLKEAIAFAAEFSSCALPDFMWERNGNR